MTFDQFQKQVNAIFYNQVTWSFTNNIYDNCNRERDFANWITANTTIGVIQISINIPTFSNDKLVDMANPVFDVYVSDPSEFSLLDESFENAAKFLIKHLEETHRDLTNALMGSEKFKITLNPFNHNTGDLK